jgi:hypothetical protein
MTSKTSAKVAKLATEQASVKGLALIGIFGSDSAPGALIRERNGTISRVGVGDRAGGAVVSAISDKAIVLTRGGRNSVLKLPEK